LTIITGERKGQDRLSWVILSFPSGKTPTEKQKLHKKIKKLGNYLLKLLGISKVIAI
jgi:hypothetical protein